MRGVSLNKKWGGGVLKVRDLVEGGGGGRFMRMNSGVSPKPECHLNPLKCHLNYSGQPMTLQGGLDFPDSRSPRVRMGDRVGPLF